ncbi:MAG: hypothetical protein OEW52_07055 [Thermoleophilia bacterium]|nr:hypothetical protein [Thermoleophilia bacterium]MDH4339079.1 hypothetical protein [Thermoleophilia bacterium]MDH5280895.1 hypothetical protein [Thermoleophilia bacterium]
MSDVRDAHAADEIHEGVAVDVGARGSTSFCCSDRRMHDQRARHSMSLPLEDHASARR